MGDGATLAKIGELIKSEEDLNKISSLRQQFMKEKSSVDIKLSQSTQQQINSIMNNLTQLNNTAKRLGSIKSNISKVNTLYEDSVVSVEHYELIRKMTTVNQYLAQVSNLYNDISGYKDYLEILERQIRYELEKLKQDLKYTLPHLFEIHYGFTQARNFQDYLEEYSQGLSDDLQSIIYKIVAPMKKTTKLFEELLNEAIIGLTEAAKDENYECIYRLIKVIEYEDKEDLKFTLMENLKLNQGRDGRTVNYANFRRARRNYKKFFYLKLEASIQESFDNCVDHYYEDKMMVYENLEWLEDELMFVVNNLEDHFPASWKISKFILDAYHNQIHKFTIDIINSEPTAEDLLKILSYDSHYTKYLASISQDSKLGKLEGKSIMGEELKTIVLEDYMKMIISKMNEWNDNLMKQETASFKQRTNSPDIYTYRQIIEDEDINDQLITYPIDTDVYVLPDFKTPLTLLKEQADVAAGSGYSKIMVGVVENWTQCYIKRTKNFHQLVLDEFDRYMSINSNEKFLLKESKTSRLFKRKNASEPALDVENMTAEELDEISRPGLIEYLTALGNTYEINTNRLQEKFLPRYKEKVHTNYHVRLTQAFEDIMIPTTDLNAEIIANLAEIIVNDLYPALSIIFTKKWYEGSSQTSDEPEMAHLIVQTIAEYMEEFRGYSTYDMYLITFNVLLDSFISKYIRIGYENILYGDAKKIDPKAVKKYKSFTEAVGRDITIFYKGLEHLFTRKDKAYLASTLRAIEYLGDLGTCENPSQTIPEIWEHEILSSFYYCSVEYVRGVCLCRKDMDRAQVNELMGVLERIQREYHALVEPPATGTLFLNEFKFKDK